MNTGYPYTNFKLETTSGISSNTSGKLLFDGKEYDVNLYSVGDTSQYSNLVMPNAEGTYPYSVVYNNKTVCAGTINIIPSLSCSVDKTTVGIGEEYIFSAHRNTNCYNCSYQFDNGTENNIQFGDGIYDISKTKTASSLGSKTLNFSCTCDNVPQSCSQNITVTEVPPTITCPADLTGIALNSNVSVTPQSLTGCTNGCNYTIEGTSATGSGYTGGEVSFTGESTAGEKTYTWYVSNSKGSDNCEFKVTYEEGGSVVPTCNCTCPTGCDNVITTGWNSSNTSGCYFATTFDIGAWNNSVINVNGSEFSNSKKTQNDFTLIDGGFYIQIIESYYPSVNIGTGTPNCGGSGGGGSTDPKPAFSCPADLSFEVNSSVTITPTGVTGCSSGCDYEISGTSVQGNSYTGGALPSFTAPSTAGTSNYTITLTNSTGSTSHNCSVEFTESGSGGGGSTISVSVGKGESNFVSFTPGNTYSVTITGGGSVFRCVTTSFETSERIIGVFNGSPITMPAWNTGSTTVSNPGSGSTVEFIVDASAPSSLKCGTDW